MYQIFHSADLKTVYHKIDQCFIRIGIIPLCIDNGHTVFEGFRERPADLRLPGRDDERRFGAVKALHKEIHSLGGCGVGHDGVKGQHPASQHDAADDVKDHIVDHHKTSEAQSQPLCEHHPEDIDPVDGAAESHGKAAAASRDDPAENGAQKQIRLREGRGDRHIHGQDIRDDPCGDGVYQHRIDGIDGESRPLFFQPKQEDGDIEQHQDQRQAAPRWRLLGDEHGRTGYAAVKKLYRRKEHDHAEGIDDARRC